MIVLFTGGLVALTTLRQTTTILVALVVLIPGWAAQAEIGWTFEQLAKKYKLGEGKDLLTEGGKGGWSGCLI
jgi:hypothetical protein